CLCFEVDQVLDHGFLHEIRFRRLLVSIISWAEKWLTSVIRRRPAGTQSSAKPRRRNQGGNRARLILGAERHLYDTRRLVFIDPPCGHTSVFVACRPSPTILTLHIRQLLIQNEGDLALLLPRADIEVHKEQRGFAHDLSKSD